MHFSKQEKFYNSRKRKSGAVILSKFAKKARNKMKSSRKSNKMCKKRRSYQIKKLSIAQSRLLFIACGAYCAMGWNNM